MNNKAIIFDLGGTLIEYVGPFASWPELETPGLQAAYTCLRSKGVALPEFDQFCAAGFEILPDRWQMATSGQKNLRLTDFLVDVLKRFSVTNVEAEWLAEASGLYEGAICGQAFPLEGAAEILALVQKEGYKIGLLSNTMFSGQAHIADLERFALAGYFDAMLFSADVGKWKPSADPYLNLLDQLQVKPHNGIFIGDDPVNDMVGAQKAGMGTVWMRSSQRFHMPENVQPDAVITHLSELPAILVNWSIE